MFIWEVENGVNQAPVRFFSEYCCPVGRELNFPERFFWATEGYYSLHSENKGHLNYVIGNFSPAIKYGDKIAIVMKEKLFGKFLQAFFCGHSLLTSSGTFQRA